jgi:O-antigen ligase
MTGISRRRTSTVPSVTFGLSAWACSIFLVFVFLLGGSSRSDIASLPFLRSVSVLVALWAALSLDRGDWARIRVPLLLLFLLSLWMMLQLVPLPPAVWQALPGRDTIAAIDRLLGQPQIWRPLSLTPSQTWNSLLAMTVPVAALLVAARLGADEYRRVLLTLIGIAVFSALLGFVQILSGAGNPAFLYRITNTESMVGLFANRNHHSIFQAAAVLLSAMMLRDELMRKQRRKSTQLVLVLSMLLFTLVTFLIGSRAGLAAGACTFAIGYFMAVSAFRATAADRARARGRAVAPATVARQAFFLAPPILLGLLFAVIIWYSERVTSVSRLADQSVVEDLRVVAWPVVRSMIESFWILGSGFGSFPDTFKVFEPDSLLQPAYFNHAHNDWAELAMTGGIPALLILLTAIVWIARRVASQGMRNLIKGHRGDGRLTFSVIIGLFAVASIFDYPLRVPSLQAMAIVLIVIFCCPKPVRTPRD